MKLSRIHIWASVSVFGILILLIFPKTPFSPGLIAMVLSSSWLLASKQEINVEFKRSLSKIEIVWGLVLAAFFVLIATGFQIGNFNDLISESFVRLVAVAALLLVLIAYFIILLSNKNANKT